MVNKCTVKNELFKFLATISTGQSCCTKVRRERKEKRLRRKGK